MSEQIKNRRALIGADIFDGDQLHFDKALLLNGNIFQGIAAPEAVPEGYAAETLDRCTILPGFVDLQVNGGGGVMFNDETSLEGLVAIAKAHASTGTRALLPTLITDAPERTRAAVDAVESAISQQVPGIIGIHLEGPHLSVARKGAHDPGLIRPMDDADEAFLIDAAKRLPNVMVTVAPESVRFDQMTRLSDAGVILSLGHTDCDVDTALSAFKAGVRCVTHLFNAMSQLQGRNPGLVGATLGSSQVSAGLIADGIHVHPASMRAAIRAKGIQGEMFLVTDAMATVGSDITAFQLNGRKVLRQNGRLTLEDGTLAGADLTLSHALSIVVSELGIPRHTAYAMATSRAASVLRNPMSVGSFTLDQPCDPILLDRSQMYLRSA